jgi:hypothetical protein
VKSSAMAPSRTGMSQASLHSRVGTGGQLRAGIVGVDLNCHSIVVLAEPIVTTMANLGP